MKILARSWLLLCIILLFFSGVARSADRDALWSKVNQQCVPDYINNDTYTPCALVNVDEKYVIYKVDNDKYQYLLLPTEKISGIEDEKLLNEKQNYIYRAWQSRTFLTEKLNKKIKERDIALTMNAKNARGQDQLHIHISCLSPSARKTIDAIDIKSIGEHWSTKAIEINPYSFYFKKISLGELKKDNIFKLIKSKADQIGADMNYSGVALVNIDINTFMILLSPGTVDKGVSAELIQDHECSIAN